MMIARKSSTKDLCDSIRNATTILGSLARKRIKDDEIRLEVLKQANRIDKALGEQESKIEYKLKREKRRTKCKRDSLLKDVKEVITKIDSAIPARAGGYGDPKQWKELREDLVKFVDGSAIVEAEQ